MWIWSTTGVWARVCLPRGPDERCPTDFLWEEALPGAWHCVRFLANYAPESDKANWGEMSRRPKLTVSVSAATWQRGSWVVWPGWQLVLQHLHFCSTQQASQWQHVTMWDMGRVKRWHECVHSVDYRLRRDLLTYDMLMELDKTN